MLGKRDLAKAEKYKAKCNIVATAQTDSYSIDSVTAGELQQTRQITVCCETMGLERARQQRCQIEQWTKGCSPSSARE